LFGFLEPIWDGGILYNLGRERFVFVYDERAELAPRDVVNNLKSMVFTGNNLKKMIC